MPAANSPLNGKQTLNESPSEKEGKSVSTTAPTSQMHSLNESPSEKEGKFPAAELVLCVHPPSMKVPPKRKGNPHLGKSHLGNISLNESPSEKEGKYLRSSASERRSGWPSMKVPPKRKGNSVFFQQAS